MGSSKVDRELDSLLRQFQASLKSCEDDTIYCHRNKLVPTDLINEKATSGLKARLALSEYFKNRFDTPFFIQNLYVVQFLKTILKIYTPVPQEIVPPSYFSCHDTTLNHKGKDYLALLGDKISSNISLEIAKRAGGIELLFPLQEDIFSIKEYKVMDSKKVSLYYFSREELGLQPEIPSLKSKIYEDFLSLHGLSDGFKQRDELKKALAQISENALGDKKKIWLSQETVKKQRTLTQEEVNSLLIKKSS